MKHTYISLLAFLCCAPLHIHGAAGDEKQLVRRGSMSSENTPDIAALATDLVTLTPTYQPADAEALKEKLATWEAAKTVRDEETKRKNNAELQQKINALTRKNPYEISPQEITDHLSKRTKFNTELDTAQKAVIHTKVTQLQLAKLINTNNPETMTAWTEARDEHQRAEKNLAKITQDRASNLDKLAKREQELCNKYNKTVSTILARTDVPGDKKIICIDILLEMITTASPVFMLVNQDNVKKLKQHKQSLENPSACAVC
jgi:hypothetical protein